MGLGVLSSTGDVLVRGVGGVCDMYMCLARGGVGGEGGEWMRELGFGLYQFLWGQGECWGHVSVFLVAVVWGGVGGEWVGGLGQGSGAVGWCLCLCEVVSLDSLCRWQVPCICVLCLADTCTSEVHPVFNPVAPYGYLLSDMYFVYGRYHKSRLSCLKLSDLDLVSTSPAFVSSSASHPAGSAWPACPKKR